MKKIKEELKKLLVSYLDEWVCEHELDRASTCDIVDDILNPSVFPNIAVVDRDIDVDRVGSPDPHTYEGEFEAICATKEMFYGWVKEVK